MHYKYYKEALFPGDVKLEQVIDELKEIADDWKLFGSHFLSEDLLTAIEIQDQSPVKCLELLIVHWKEASPDGNWMDIVAALKKIKNSKLANLLQQKYATGTVSYNTDGIIGSNVFNIIFGISRPSLQRLYGS